MFVGFARRALHSACSYFPVAATAALLAMAQPEAGSARNLVLAAIGSLDTLRGTAVDDVLRGSAGKDLLDGGAGDDRLLGLDGDDVLTGGPGRDWLDGGVGSDVLEGGDDNDILDGGDGNDWLFGDKGDDWLLGGPGNDALDGGVGDNRLDGGPGDDMLMGGIGNDVLFGGVGNDHLEGAEGNDILDGGDGDDFLDGGEGDNILRGGAGADTLFGDEEDDHLDGGIGNDLLFGDDGNDVLKGDVGDDALTGGDGTDDLDGGAGNDALNGDDDNDVLLGGAGLDSLFGGAQNDRLDGGLGNDLLRGDDGDDFLEGGQGDDYLIGGRGTDVQNGGPQNDVFLLRVGDVDSARIELLDGGTNPGPREEADTLLLSGFTDTNVRRVQTANGLRVEITDPITGGTYIVVRVETILFLQVVPFMAGTGTSALQVVNVASAELNGLIRFVGANGLPLAVAVAADSARPVHSVKIPSRGATELTVRPAGAGSIWLYSDQPVSAVLRTALPDSLPGVVPAGPVFEELLLPVTIDRRNGSTIGFAATSGVNSAMKVLLLTPSGGELDEVVLDIPSRGQVTRFLNEVFPRFEPFVGKAIVFGGPFVGVRLVVDRGRLSVAPPVAWPGSGPALVPHLVGGAGNSTSITVFGLGIPQDSVRNGRVAFFDNQGRPLAINIDGFGAVTEVPFQFGPNGSVALSTAAAGPPVEGSAVVTTGTGRVVVAVGARLAADRSISTVANRGHTAFVGAVRRNEAEQVTTSITVSAGAEPATVEFALRGPDGQRVAEGVGRVSLPAYGRSAQPIERLFPRAQLANFRGSVEITASGGAIGVTVVELGRATATSMPVTVLQ